MFEAVLTIERQASICEFNVVLSNSQSLGHQHTNSNQRRWWDLFGKRPPEGVVERLERNFESWGSRKKGDTRGPDYGSPPSVVVSSSPLAAGLAYRLLVVDPFDLCVLQKEEKHGRAGKLDLR